MKKKTKGIFEHIFYYSDDGKLFLVFSLCLSVIGMICNVIPYVSVYFIGKNFLISGDNNETIIFWIAIAGFAILLNLIFTFLGGLGCHKVAFKTLYTYRINIMEHLGKLPIGFFSKNTSGSIQKVMDENIEKLESIVAHMLPDNTQAALVPILSLILSFAVSVRVGIIILVLSISCALLLKGMMGNGEG